MRFQINRKDARGLTQKDFLEQHRFPHNAVEGYQEFWDGGQWKAVWWNRDGYVETAPFSEEMWDKGLDDIYCCDTHRSVDSFQEILDMHGADHLEEVKANLRDELISDIRRWPGFREFTPEEEN